MIVEAYFFYCLRGLSMMKPMIAVTMARDDKQARDYLRTTYVEAIREAGGVPVLLPNVVDSVDALNWCDGLLLTGGGDFLPSTFGQEDDGTDWTTVCAERDQTELRLLDRAESLGIPVFGICRGIQALAVWAGGTLIQDIGRARPDSSIHHQQSADRSVETHTVRIESPSRLADMLDRESLSVNSLHHQAVKSMPEGWKVSAVADDGIIEGMERLGPRLVFGVQWHPEDLVHAQDSARRLFSVFVQEAVTVRERRSDSV